MRELADFEREGFEAGKKVRAIWLNLAPDFVADGVPFEEAKGALSESIANDKPGREAIRKVLAGLKQHRGGERPLVHCSMLVLLLSCAVAIFVSFLCSMVEAVPLSLNSIRLETLKNEGSHFAAEELSGALGRRFSPSRNG